jgi:hypothetical protein
VNLNDILNWISRNGLAAFLIGCFLTSMAGIVANFLLNAIRALTGKYPEPRPVIQTQCDHENQCYCCRENGCQDGCRCNEDGE